MSETETANRITGADFLCIGTTDIDRAVEFYGETLGLERSKQWGNMPAFEFETGNLTIAVMQMDAFGQEFKPSGSPLALRVEDFAAARAELEAKGVEFVMDDIDSGVCHMGYFKDPDGNMLILHHRYAPAE
jgi:catechol 2,3-dioxygenase-like lactoylglutathione lyase family enzyme